MFSIRQKLFFGLGGTVIILAGVGILSGLLLTKYSSTLERIFRENYDSVRYGQSMKDIIDELDDRAQMQLWSATPYFHEPFVTELMGRFEENLAYEKKNITLSGEGEVTTDIERMWKQYRRSYVQIADSLISNRDRRFLYQEHLLPNAHAIKRLAQKIVDINLANIVSIDGQVKASATFARNTMMVLVFMGILLGLVFTSLVGSSILRPLAMLTDSIREIEKGNLDLIVDVKSTDELGQLAQAFNSMAAKLREYRNSDRAKLFRMQKITQLALNTFPDAVLIAGIDGKVELSNEMAQKQFDIGPGVDLLSPKHKRLWDLFQKVFTTMTPLYPKGYDTVMQVFFGGQEHYFLPQAVPIIGEDKNLHGVTIVLADVTELRRLDEMKSNLVSVVSHELKTPLTSIRMTTHLLLEERIGPLNNSQTDLLVTARDDAERLNNIIEKLLDIGRIESGHALMDLKPVAVEQLINQAVEQFATAYRDHGIALVTEIDADLPDVMADLSRISHVFSNLLDNAMKYTPSGGEVSISARLEGEFVIFSVKDSGRGIPPDALPRIFERFYRVADQEDIKGAGLGLAIAREIIHAHGGTINVNSILGAGSTFTFNLKISQ